MLEQGISVRSKEQQRDMNCPEAPLPFPCAAQVVTEGRGTGDEGVKFTLQKERGVGIGVVLYFLFFLSILFYFN